MNHTLKWKLEVRENSEFTETIYAQISERNKKQLDLDSQKQIGTSSQ